jgi:transposase
MPKVYSCDLRERVIEAVEMGRSRREPAQRSDVSMSSAIKWLQRWQGERSATRYDKLARNFLAGIHLASAIILLN